MSSSINKNSLGICVFVRARPKIINLALSQIFAPSPSLYLLIVKIFAVTFLTKASGSSEIRVSIKGMDSG